MSFMCWAYTLIVIQMYLLIVPFLIRPYFFMLTQSAFNLLYTFFELSLYFLIFI